MEANNDTILFPDSIPSDFMEYSYRLDISYLVNVQTIFFWVLVGGCSSPGGSVLDF